MKEKVKWSEGEKERETVYEAPELREAYRDDESRGMAYDDFGNSYRNYTET